MTQPKIIKIPYDPRPLQAELHKTLTQYSVVVAHRRFGKTMFCVAELVFKGLSCPLEEPQYSYLAPEKAQAKRTAWKYIKRMVRAIPDHRIFESELRVEFPTIAGSTATIYLDGAEEPDRLRGIYLDGVIIDETAQIPRSVWSEVLMPALGDRDGWAIFIGTPKGQNFFKELTGYVNNVEINKHKLWSTKTFKASETGLVSNKVLDTAKAIDIDKYLQEYECSFDAAVPGAYYGKAIVRAREEMRIGAFNWNNKYPVTVALDIGANDKTSIWFAQSYGNQIFVIDFWEDKGITDLTPLVNLLKAKPYSYEKIWLPHDANQRRFGMAQTPLLQFKNSGFSCGIVQRLNIDDGIMAAKSILPICFFNEIKCAAGLDALAYYHSERNEKNEVQKISPVHDWSSHAADAFRYLALAIKDNSRGYSPLNPFAKSGTKIRKYGDNWNILRT